MRTYLNQLQNLYNSVCKLINDNLRPNPKYAKCTLELEIAHKRNKAVFTICFYYQFIFFYDMFINNGPILVNLANLGAIYFIWFVLFLSCRHHPQIFKTLYSLLCMSFGPMIMNGGSESITYAFVNMGTLAILVQAVTGSYKHFVVQTIAQALLANTLYQKPLEEMLVTTAPEKILQYLTYSANLMLMIQSFIVILIHRSLAQAQEQGYILEQKKIEAENQKTFLLGFSHELRNLINSLTGNVKLASLENINVKAKEFLLNAEVCGELLLHLINNILDSGKAAIGELEINPAPTKTYETFEKIWAICSELIRRKNLRGSIKMSKNLPRTLMIDQHRLTQIFLNLVGNAIKFTEKGSIDILVEWLPDSQTVNEECFQPYPFNNTDDQDEGVFEKWRSFSYLKLDHFVLSTKCKGIDCKEIKRAPFATRGVLKMVVTDDGCGMSKAQTSRLFQKFMQVTTDSSKKKLGTGLGLFITKQLCDRMNGEVRVFSELGKGSSFMLCIPTQVVFENNQILNSQESFRTYATSTNLKAMIVDDLACNHIILESFLNNLGIQVSSILMDGLQAYKKYLELASSSNFPQIIAMDLDMPVMDGKEASKKIREFEAENGLKPALLMIISGNCIESEIAECLDKRGRIQADAFLRKPIRIDDLTRVLSLHYLNC